MLVKTVLIFLLVMLLIGMVGKLLFPRTAARMRWRRGGAATCPACGRPLIGQAPCGCRGRR